MSRLTTALVATGQVWVDADSRRRGRTVRVDKVDETHVYVRVLTNSVHTQNLVDSGQRQLDQRGRTSTILKNRFASDCYTPKRLHRGNVSRLPGACADLQKHRWQPTLVIAACTPSAHVVLVCTKCSAHTKRVSPYLQDIALEGDLAT
ncbi:hypothetical protein ACIOEX_21725 [Streptomyces sp. NPDC087850]|uniref:hypothetical protein n=1 Tax=Streptomyces sp. NPDC087850 TaxID=3365809 RepID=UPI00382BA151